MLPPALAPLAAFDQWVCWIALPHPDKPGKFNKFPIDWRTGDIIDGQDPAYWTTADVALAMGASWDRGWGAGAGFVFTERDPFAFLDIDSCDLGGQWSPIAQELMARLPGAAVELSHSRRGLHVIGTLTRPLEHSTRNTPLGLELYTARRFIALTGYGWPEPQGSVSTDITEALASVIAQYFQKAEVGDWAGWTDEPVPGWSGPDDDDELVRKARAVAQRSAAGAFGGVADKVTFEDLWTGNAEALGRAFPPDDNSSSWNGSSADQALANHLAFWTGKNCERMDRLMRASGLARSKYDSPRPEGTYLRKTILAACAFVQSVATGPRAATAAPVVAPPPPEELRAASEAAGVAMREPGTEYMGVLMQLDHFKGCYFLADHASVYDQKRDAIMAKASFDVVYGGHLFVLDPEGRKTTDSAWDAFTKSRVNICRIVDDLCFRPELPVGHVVRDGNRSLVNSYVPHDVPMVDGDPARLVELLAKQLPVATDAELLLHYMASVVQNPGRKFQWWPVLQGCEGNGKTIWIEILRFAMGAHRSHVPNAHAMARDGLKFNKWIYRKLFVGVEEIALANRRDFLDEFKIIVTNKTIPVEGKGADQINFDNRANGMFCTNHRDGVPITYDGRRYGVFFTAQQEAEDLDRDGMGGGYFPDLYDWLNGAGVYKHLGVNYGLRVAVGWLKRFALKAELDPARLLQRCPQTSSTAEAVKNSLGRAEQEVMEAVAEGRPGFAGGWVSSIYLDQLLERVRASVPRNRRRDMMRLLGFVTHPALDGGRVNIVVNPDAGKPTLYLRAGHLAFNVSDPNRIAKMYSDAQNPLAASAAEQAFGT